MTALACLLLLQQTPAAIGQRLADEYVSSNRVVGVAASVVVDGRRAFSIYAGYADRELPRPVSESTLFRLGSVSKSVTAVGAMKLVEEGKLSLADTLDTLAEWPKGRPRVRLDQLLSHTGGVRHYLPGDQTGQVFQTYTTSQAIGLFSGSKLLFEPGTKESYSTHAYTLVARMIESASGQSFTGFMRRQVFVPGLDCELLAEPKAARTSLYSLTPNAVSKAERREDNSWKYAGGGMEATSNALADWADRVRAERIIGKTSLDRMWTPTVLKDGTATGYGLGWRIAGPIVSHGGAQQGCRSFLLVDREKKISVAVLTNTDGRHDPSILARELADLASR